ncbi:MAG: nuclear transport factor 2 family protein [Desulfobacteraceae bacterium]|nr:nuclear transport factor 2 family protein [Desulfobacteraceae bacterium]MBU4000753.1 nuclear transport factor 2 family protein [Pseudomonadota bacterium]MBU4054456.1 nuclear transport factor 2 family protein [Pseudomonadota bacterium]
MDEAALLERIDTLEKEVQRLKDVEKIKNLQRAYGYYIENWMAQEIIDLFSDGPDVSLTLAAGTYLGKDGVCKYFERADNNNPEFMHQVMQLSSIITVDPDGTTATGRWYGFGAVAMPAGNGVNELFMGGTYEGKYVKEDGVWKFKALRFDMKYTATPDRGWVKPDRKITSGNVPPEGRRDLEQLKADIPREISSRYPSGYILPFHYNHPVTGKKTSEEKRNEKRTSK